MSSYGMKKLMRAFGCVEGIAYKKAFKKMNK